MRKILDGEKILKVDERKSDMYNSVIGLNNNTFLSLIDPRLIFTKTQGGDSISTHYF